MEPLELTRDICRICLEHKENINWNEWIQEFCKISYKDCYYKYTQLDEPDIDYFPTSLCKRCASKLKDTHMLFEMAFESFKILQNTFKAKDIEPENTIVKICNSSQEIDCDSSFMDEKTYIEIDETLCFSPAYEYTVDQNEFDYEGNSETSYKNSLASFTQQDSTNYFNIKLLKPSGDKEESNERKTVDSFETTLELNIQLEIHGSKLLKAFHTKSKKKTNECKTFYKSSMKKEIENSCLIKLGPQQKFQHTAMIQSKIKNNQQLSSPNIFDDQTCVISNDSLLDLNIDETQINTEVNINPKILKKPINIPVKKEKQSNLLLKKNCSEIDAGLAPLAQISTKPKELENSYISNNKSRESKNSSIADISIKKYEKSMLKKIFGKDIDIHALIARKPQKPRELMCQYCSVKVNGASHLKKHEATHLENRERKIICTKCGMKFYTKESLNTHKQTHDENRVKKNKCEFCSKAFFHRGALNVHRRIHLGQMIKCQLCPKEFYRQIDLERHLPTHSASALQSKGLKGAKQKKYTVKCQYCNASVLTTKWRTHKAAHLNEPQVKCNICDKDFFSRHSCYRHIKQTHRKTGNEIEENIYSYVDWSRRMSHLMLEQQECLTPLIA